MRSVKNTLCGNWTATNADKNAATVNELRAFKDFYCYIFNTSNIDYQSCIDNCSPPCVELLYDTSVSTSGPSPSVGYQRAFYENYIAETSFADAFSDYKDIIAEYDAGSIIEVNIAFALCFSATFCEI